MLSIVSILQGGRLEIETCLLNWSIQNFFQGKYRLHVGIPNKSERIKQPAKSTIDFLKDLGCNLFQFDNKYLNHSSTSLTGDLISNKLFVLDSFTDAKYVLLLDSDILTVSTLHVNELLPRSDIMLKPVNRANVTAWKEIYSYFDLPFPNCTITTCIDKVSLPPYFNSGVVLIKGEILPLLFSMWQDFYYRLSNQNLLKKSLYPVYHRDQVALALSIQSLNIQWDLLDEQFNCPARNDKLRSISPKLLHYHDPFRLYYFRRYRTLVDKFGRNAPKSIFNNSPKWHHLFDNKFSKAYFISYYLKNKLSLLNPFN